MDPEGFQVRHPPPPHELTDFITPDDRLFQTTHMGVAVVDEKRWILLVDGLVQRSFSLSLEQLRSLPPTTITSFHECFGSPLKPPVEALWRVGNVQWTGVRLRTLLQMTGGPLQTGRYVWSEGLDYGKFAGVSADRYQKDMPLVKAMSPEVLVAYKMNGQPLSKERGGPVRLVVPGWFGTNSTKWLCRLTVQADRAPSPYTTTFYNTENHEDPAKGHVPVWEVDVNSTIVSPSPDSVIHGSEVAVSGWAWSNDSIESVHVSTDEGSSWSQAMVQERTDYSWQKFRTTLRLSPGPFTILARATSIGGRLQPMSGRRNHVHSVSITVE